MDTKSLFEQFTHLEKSDQQRFLNNALSHLYGEISPDWAEAISNGITKEEWHAMEAELQGIRQGSIQATPLQQFISSLK